MAYAVLVSLAQTIDEILIHDQRSISLLHSQQITSIHEYVIYLQTFFEYFPEKVNADLEGKIRDVSTEAEDVIEHFMWKKQYDSCYGQWPDHHHGLDELKRVAKKFDSIVRDATKIKNSFKIKDITSNVDDSPSSSSSRLAPSHKREAMIGFDVGLVAIKERLCGESSKLQVIPIVGMGGIGKTTLATHAYFDPLIVEHFQIRAWVTVSQDYSAKKVFSELLNSMKEFKTGSFDQTHDEQVYKILKGRKYLIVMDDIWSTQAWDVIMRILPDDDNGSRIMLTTRLSDVAAYADSSRPPHEMRLMDNDQSWDLLHHKVFTHEEQRCTLELESIGKEIARCCKGLPLAIVVIAGVLSTVSKTRVSWEAIAKNIKSTINATKDGQFEKIFSLSYTHLPHHLRPCFLYIGGFPEDHDIRVSKLIKLWVAEGFLKYPSGSKSYEEVAGEYLEDLVKRSLVLVTRTKSNDKVKSCSVHDLVRDLCVRKAKEERLFTLVDNSSGKIAAGSVKYQRRLYITRCDPIIPAYIRNSKILRTIICFQSRSTSLGHLGIFNLLRILDVVDTYVKSLPDEVFKLFRLRYLAFRSNEKIPAGISNLQNLQTLTINSSRKTFYRKYSRPHVVYLPEEIWKMPQLRHLVSPMLVLKPFLPVKLFNAPEKRVTLSPMLVLVPFLQEKSTYALENLVTLEISVDIMSGTVGMFRMIPNLKKLNISYHGDGRFDNNDYHLDELVHLHQLENLTLNRLGSPWGKFEPTFPKTLKKLTLSGWRLPWDGDVMRNVGSLPKLQVLKLKYRSFDGEKWETREGEFSQLKFLLIKDSHLKEWITESSHFPTLKCLLLHRCRYLKEIPDGIGEILTLELIEFKECDITLAQSAKRLQEAQQEFGNDALQLRYDDRLLRSLIYEGQKHSEEADDQD